MEHSSSSPADSSGEDSAAEQTTFRLRLIFANSEQYVVARQVSGHEADGVFEVVGPPLSAPLGVGDLVRAQLDGRGNLQIVDIVQAETLHSFVSVEVLEAMEALVQGWAAGGASWSIAMGGPMLLTGWDSDLESTAAILHELEKAGLIHVLELLTGETRKAILLADSVLTLDVQKPPAPTHTTDYWAAEDPFWAANGCADAETLAFIQTMVREDPRIARAVEQGKQDQVLLYLHRLRETDPEKLLSTPGPNFE